MNNKTSLAVRTLVVCVLAVSSAVPTAAGRTQASTNAVSASTPAPVVRKIEPPNWWINYTPKLTLLLTGENLSGARVNGLSNGVTVLSSTPSANGHYLFVHLRLRSDRLNDKISLQVRSSGGSAAVTVPLARRADPHGHYQGFSHDDVIYLIMPDRFADGDPSNDQPAGSNAVYDRSKQMAYHGGDLRGIRQHLDYLHDLGVNTLWLTPVWKNTDSDYHGYHVVDFYALDERMGSMEEYRLLVADAHKLGMKVLIDYVANHTGPKHPWASDPPTPSWLHGTAAHHLDASYNFNELVDPHASPRQYRNTIEGWFANKLPDLNPDDPELGVYLAQNALWWTEMAELDGFRLDTFPYSSRAFWSGWHTRLREVYPHIDSIGEVADPDPSITAFFQGGRKQFDGIDSGVSTVFDFPMRNALRDVVIKGEPIKKIVDVLGHDDLYPHPENLVTFLGNHDDRRFMGVDGSSPAKLKAAFSLLLTMRGIPQIYSGDEIAMAGGDDPDNRRDFPGGFPGDARNAFTAAGRTREQQDVFAHVQALLALRKAHPALRSGKQWHIGWDETYYAFLRDLQEEKLLIVYNNAITPRSLEIPVDDTPLEKASRLETLFGGAPAEIVAGKIKVSLAAQTLVVFSVR
jgi:glycosidase